MKIVFWLVACVLNKQSTLLLNIAICLGTWDFVKGFPVSKVEQISVFAH